MVFLVIAGVTYPFALAVVVAVCDLIPQVGATLGAVIVSAVGFATSSISVGIACVIFFVIHQQVENFLIYPKVMRRAVKISGLAAIIAALLGIALLDVVGALIAIPAVAGIQLIVREIVLPRQERSSRWPVVSPIPLGRRGFAGVSVRSCWTAEGEPPNRTGCRLT